MATVTNLKLQIDFDVANANVAVDYDINFDGFDQRSNLTYLDECTLIGDDSGPFNDAVVSPTNHPEDGTDDILGKPKLGSVRNPSNAKIVAANGRDILHRHRTTTIAKVALDEDVGIDEIRALVRLTPQQLPTAVAVKSNSVIGNFVAGG